MATASAELYRHRAAHCRLAIQARVRSSGDRSDSSAVRRGAARRIACMRAIVSAAFAAAAPSAAFWISCRNITYLQRPPSAHPSHPLRANSARRLGRIPWHMVGAPAGALVRHHHQVDERERLPNRALARANALVVRCAEGRVPAVLVAHAHELLPPAAQCGRQGCGTVYSLAWAESRQNVLYRACEYRCVRAHARVWCIGVLAQDCILWKAVRVVAIVLHH